MVFKKGNIPHNKGQKHSEETKKKMSKSQSDRYKKGFKLSEEARNKIREAKKGKRTSIKSEFKKGYISYRKDINLSEETKKKMSKSKKGKKLSEKHIFKLKQVARKGKDSPFWTGGENPLYTQIRKTNEYKKWRKSIYERDDYVCQKCGNKGDINSHHIKSFIVIFKENKIETLEDAIKCDEFWDLNNGITLCKECHKKTHSSL
jgi:Zn-dependent oligopeptidase